MCEVDPFQMFNLLQETFGQFSAKNLPLPCKQLVRRIFFLFLAEKKIFSIVHEYFLVALALHISAEEECEFKYVIFKFNFFPSKFQICLTLESWITCLQEKRNEKV